MARFYAEIQGQRGETSRLGSKDSGIRGHIRGWNIGGSVHLSVNDQGEDVVSVRLTRGSNGHGQGKCLGQWVVRDGEFIQV